MLKLSAIAGRHQAEIGGRNGAETTGRIRTELDGRNEPNSAKDPKDSKKCPVCHLTTNFGAPVVDNQNSMTAGPRGPLLMQDVWLNEKLANFNRENIPERRMHAKGSGAFGTFTVTNDITNYTKAKIFEKVGKKTEMFARFTTVAGERGAADAERDIRGFALKFYTEEGNWDMVGNNTPVFFLRDPRKFPDLNKAVKRDPKTNLRSATNNWDFWTLLPEALHQVTIVMSDRGIPKSYRHMHGFSSHTYSFINAKNERFWVKMHFRTQQGIENLTDAESSALVGADRESHQRDLFDSIERKDFPKWTMSIQVMPIITDCTHLISRKFGPKKITLSSKWERWNSIAILKIFMLMWNKVRLHQVTLFQVSA